MCSSTRNIAIFGSTGSIGVNALDVIAASGGRLRAFALSGHTRLERLAEQARQFRPDIVVATDPGTAAERDAFQWPDDVQLAVGSHQLESVASHPDIDIVLAAIVGCAGLRSTWAAIEAGKQVALANKETLVVAGPLVLERARETSARLLPVDSEHNAIFQALECGRRRDVRRVILTASGGPFRQHSLEALRHVTVEEALAHPTWDMGPKITIDSATMMNKALEIIEARWLFDLSADQIEVVVHPQSIVHSMVEFADGSVLAQLSPPDMRLPIQYAFTYPERWECPSPGLDISTAFRLEFEPADHERFPALELGLEVARQGGTAGAVLNGANEAAVAGFLDGRLQFHEIVPACRRVLEHHDFEAHPTLDRLMQLDAWARKEMERWVCT